MWLPKSGNSDKKFHGNGNGNGNGLVALAIDNNKGSQHALKWVVSNLLSKGQTLVLIHVLHKPTTSTYSSLSGFNFSETNHSTKIQQLEKQAKELFLTFHCYCTRKDIQCLDILLEDTEVIKGIVEYVSISAIENLVLGASSRNGFIKKFKTSDVPSHVSKSAPDFCTVYVISKGKVSSVRNASRSAPFSSPLIDQIQKQSKISRVPTMLDASSRNSSFNHAAAERAARRLREPRTHYDDYEPPRPTFSRKKVVNEKLCPDLLDSESEFSYVSSSTRPSVDRMSSYDSFINSGQTPRASTSSNGSGFGSVVRMGTKWIDLTPGNDFSSPSVDSERSSCSSQCTDDVESEMRRLKLELKQTMDMYSTACKEAIDAKQKAMELQRWRMEEERRLEEARIAEEAALAIAEREKANCKAAIESAEAAQRIAELEAQMRANAEKKVQLERQQKKLSDKMKCNNFRYRRYTIDEIEAATDYFQESRKIGEGGYGPVFKCFLDHTPAAVKILRPDAAQGRAQFNQEVEVLSCIRHPNMVLLLGACPEYGCLVYEYMANGSLDDLLFRRGNTPPLSWQLRFRSAAEIATGLLFLHQTKPEPIVHRDLKPANILLDHNYTSKIGDVGLARLVPPTVADEVTQYRMTSTAGTFCYIDPEYQQTGMLGIKSDVYSLGILLLQLVTGKPAMGIAHHVGRAIEKGSFSEMLDPSVPDWPVEEALVVAKIGVQCAQLRRKDRPDLGKVVLPELNRLRELAAKNSNNFVLSGSACLSPNQSVVSSVSQDVLSDPQIIDSGFESLKSQSSLSSTP